MTTAIISAQRYHGGAPGRMGSSTIRADWLLNNWPELKAWRTGMHADAIIFQKVYWEAMLRDFKGKKILDLCDPDWMSGELKLVESSANVDAITCSNQNLTDAVAKIITDKPVVTVPDRLDLRLFTEQKKHVEKAKRVVWFGYHHNAINVLPDIIRSLGRRGLELLVVSNKPYSPLINYGCMISNIRWDPASAYQSIQTGDIAINPTIMRANYRYKSNNKTIISWALGLPVANTLDELDRFMDPGERNREAEARWAEVQRDYDIKLSVDQYKSIIGL